MSSLPYIPLPQHALPEKGNKVPLDTEGKQTPNTSHSKRNALLALGVGAFLLGQGFNVASKLHHKSEGCSKHAAVNSHLDTGDGYLQGFIDDAFALAEPYYLNPPMIHPHPLTRLVGGGEDATVAAFLGASAHHKNHHNKHHHPRHPKPFPPKLAEGIFLDVPSEESCIAAGTGGDKLTAIRVKAELEAFLGLPVSGPYDNIFEAGSAESQTRVRGNLSEPAVWIDTYYTLLNSPVSRELSILLPDSSAVQWSAKLREDIVDNDPFSKMRDEVPVFHGYSATGNVSGQVIYASYGRKEDFDYLVSKGVDFEGKIALVKYGRNFRGLKVQAAELAGAIGVLIYSDPGDDGPVTELAGYKPYPEGPARNPSAVQRGSVQYLSSYPGDPTTPGKPAYANATRVEGGNVPRIPSLPISYEDAIPLLELLKGKGIKAADIGSDWEGGLTHRVEYWTGPSEQDLRLVNVQDTRVQPIWNVMARIPGYISDESVLIGNHRDAWILGASDPNSGTAVTHEIYKGLGKLLSKGWKPLRSIYIASWDAEEYGLIGSTEWAEDFADWIPKNLVSYLNLDSTGAGTQFGAAASPSLALLLKSTSQEIRHPTDATRSAWSAKEDGGDSAKYGALGVSDNLEMFESSTGIPALGSGSDYTPFLQHLGVASTDGPGFSPGPEDPVYHYHSIYDSEYWMEKFGDVGFHRHVTAAKILGLVLLRTADSLVLPLNVTAYAMELSDYRDKIVNIDAALNDAAGNKLDLARLSAAIVSVQSATRALDDERDAALKKLRDVVHHSKTHGLFGDYHAKAAKLSSRKLKELKKVLLQIRRINHKLAGFESGFLDEAGLKDREFYRHLATAPGRWLGYGATTFPSITEALTLDHDWEEGQIESDRVAGLLEVMAERLRA